MRLLAFDTATIACSAAVWCDGRIVAARRRPMQRGHAEALMPMLRETMDDSGLDFAQLDLFATTVGPGAFTGLRIGLAAARALALALGRPVLGVGTLEAVAAAAVSSSGSAGRPILVALETRRADLYVQRFDAAGVPLEPPAAREPASAAAALPAGALALAGDGAERLVAAIDATRPELSVHRVRDLDAPDAAVIAQLAASRAACAMPAPDAPPPAPLYLRPPSVTIPRASGPRPPGRNPP